MSNPEWGMKRICPNCGTRYYDFAKEPPACPVCGTVYDPEALLKSRRTRTAVVEEPITRKKAAAKVSTDGGDGLPVVEDDDIEAVIEEEDVDVDIDVEDADLDDADAGDETLLEDDDLDDEIEEVEVENPEEEN